jgi:drug/metabolite transporter (DMT)-like permease
MPISAFLLTLLAAALHAAWNLLVKAAGDRMLSALAVTWGAAVIGLPVLAVFGLPSVQALPYLAVSCLVHSGYMVMLTQAYRRADFVLAYPLARGTAPLLVTVGGVLLVGDHLTAPGVLGVALVAGAILSLVRMPRGHQRVGAALLTGVFIATYSLIDGAAVRVTQESARYLAALFLLQAVILTIGILIARRGRIEFVPGLGRIAVIGGGASGLAYLLVLVASQQAPLGLVSGIRELSVMIGIVAGTKMLGEHVSRRHMVSVITSVIGVILIGAS